MAETSRRKTFFILALALSRVVAFASVIIKVMSDEELQERLDTTFYVLGFAIIGCVLLVLAGYVWDRTMMQRLKSLRTSVPIGEDDATSSSEPDHDEIIGLARNIERMAQA